MSILDKQFPALEALANIKETSPMQILRHAANAIVEASDIASGLAEVREAIRRLEVQVAELEQAKARAQSDLFDAVNSRNGLADALELSRADYEKTNEARIEAERDAEGSRVIIVQLENDLFEQGKAKKEVEAQLSLVRADLENVARDLEDAKARNERFEQRCRDNDATILKLIAERDSALDDLLQMEKYRDLAVENGNKRTAEAIVELDKAREKLNKMLDILTA